MDNRVRSAIFLISYIPDVPDVSDISKIFHVSGASNVFHIFHLSAAVTRVQVNRLMVVQLHAK